MRRQTNIGACDGKYLSILKGLLNVSNPRSNYPARQKLLVRESLALRLVQQRKHFLLQRGEVGCAVVLTVNLVIAANHKSCGQAKHAAEGVGYLEVAGDNGIVHLVFAIKIAQ